MTLHQDSCLNGLFFFVKQKTAYEKRISDWSSDVCSSDLGQARKAAIILGRELDAGQRQRMAGAVIIAFAVHELAIAFRFADPGDRALGLQEGVELFGEGDALEAAIERLGIVFGLTEGIGLFEIDAGDTGKAGVVGFVGKGR